MSYCHSGVQCAYAYFTAKYLGYDAALYDGSFQEWSSAAGTEVATGRWTLDESSGLWGAYHGQL